ncbi:Retrovirus-related Pol polyprotein, partial [Mucuna pruriens]
MGMGTLYSTGMPSDDQDEGVRTLLEEYSELYQEVVQLPPPRSCDHAIVIKEGSQIPNIRPYCYPHNQKDVIEVCAQYVDGGTYKANFGMKKLEYLGHIIFVEGIIADHNKVKAMVDWPIPKDVKGLRGFLGLTGYYRSFQWEEEATKAFQELKEVMTLLSSQSMPNFQLPFELETDAPGVGIEAVLMQVGRPLAFISQAFLERARKKSVYGRELMEIVYDFEIHGKRGKENCIANALSQVMAIQEISVMINEDLSMITEEMVGDPYLRMGHVGAAIAYGSLLLKGINIVVDIERVF